MASIEAADQFVSDYGEVMEAMPGETTRRRTGEQRLALRTIAEAIEESLQKDRPKASADAKEWLRDGLKLFSARVCFEALGMDYEVALEKLEKVWAKNDAK